MTNPYEIFLYKEIFRSRLLSEQKPSLQHL